MKAAISQHRTRRARTGSMLLLGLTTVILLLGQNQIAHAQRTASGTFEPFLDEFEIMVNGTFVSGPFTDEQLAGNPALFEIHSGNHLPVTMPNSPTQVRYNDIRNLTGTLEVEEVDQGTRVTVTADDLIPFGLYTVWLDFYKFPGFTDDFAHELGAGALGYDGINPPEPRDDYIGNVFTADQFGHGEIVATHPKGPASWLTIVEGFEVPQYVLDPPVFELDVILAYHIDGKTYGDAPGVGEGFDAFDGTFVGYGLAFVVPEPSSLGLLTLGMLSILAYRSRRRVS